MTELLWKTGFTMVAVRSKISGAFAIHPDLDNGEVFTLTHRPSGFKIMSGIESEVAAMEIAEIIQDLDWNFKTATTVPESTKTGMKERSKQLRKIAAK